MTKEDYRFEVYKDYEHDVYVVKYFDFDNVIGSGDTVDEAIAEARRNLDVYLSYCNDNNIKIPKPSVHKDIDHSGKVTLRMSKSLHKLVDERAKKEGISINLLLNEAVNTYITGLSVQDLLINNSINCNHSYNYKNEKYKESYLCENEEKRYYKSNNDKK